MSADPSDLIRQWAAAPSAVFAVVEEQHQRLLLWDPAVRHVDALGAAVELLKAGVTVEQMGAGAVAAVVRLALRQGMQFPVAAESVALVLLAQDDCASPAADAVDVSWISMEDVHEAGPSRLRRLLSWLRERAA